MLAWRLWGLDLAAAPSLARAEQRQDVAGLVAPYVPAGDMLGDPTVPMNLQLCPPPSAHCLLDGSWQQL